MLQHIFRLKVSDMINTAFNFVMAFLLLFLIGMIGYQTGDRGLPIDVRERYVANEDREVIAGGSLNIHMKFIVNKRCRVRIDRSIIDGENRQHLLDAIETEGAGVVQVGVPEEFTIPVPVPSKAAPGKAKHRSQSTYRCNMVQHFWPIEGPVFEDDFYIIEPTADQMQERVSEEFQDLIRRAIPETAR